MKLSSCGLKSGALDIELGQLNLVTGPNGSGKSTVADAIRFAPIGYVPLLGKRAIDTAALLSGDEMRVDLTLDDGRVISRRLSRHGEGETGSIECSWLRNAKPTEHHAAALALFGREEQDVAEVLDIRELLSATPNQRAARIEQLLAAGGATPKAKAGRVAELTARRLAGKEDAKLENWKDLLPIIPAPQLAVLRREAGMIEAKIAEGIVSVLAWANDAKRTADTESRNKRLAANEIKGRLAQLGTPTGDVAALRARQGQLEREIGAALEQGRETRRREADRSAAEAALHSATQALAAVQGEYAKAEATANEQRVKAEPMLAEIERRLTEIDASPALQTPEAPRTPEIDEAQQLEAELRELKIPASIDESAPIRARIEQLLAELARAEQSPWAEVGAIADALLRLRNAAAKNCGARLAQIVKQQSENPSEIRSQIADLEAQQGNAEKREAALVQEMTSTATRKATLELRVRELYARGEAAARARQQAAQRMHDERMAELRTLMGQRASIIGAIQSREIAAREAKASLSTTQAVAARAQGAMDRFAGIPVEAAPDIAPLEIELVAVRGQLDTLSRIEAARAELSRVVADADAFQAETEAFKGIEWAIQRVREEEIEAAASGGPLMETMRKFLSAAGRTETPYLRAARGVCEIGWSRPDGAQVPVQALSGGEYALFCAALTAAVLIVRAAPVRILIVEAGEVDAAALVALMRGIEAVAGGLTCVLLLTHLPVAERKGWTRLEFGAPAQPVVADGAEIRLGAKP